MVVGRCCSKRGVLEGVDQYDVLKTAVQKRRQSRECIGSGSTI